MHGRVAIYKYSGDVNELARTAESGMLPIFKEQPGFKAYSVVAADGVLTSFSAWDSAEDAEAANATAADWIAENLGGQLKLEQARTGEILFSTTLGVSSLDGVTA